MFPFTPHTFSRLACSQAVFLRQLFRGGQYFLGIVEPDNFGEIGEVEALMAQ